MVLADELLSFPGFPSIIWGNEIEQTRDHTRAAILGFGNTKDTGGMAPSFLFRIQPGWERSLPRPPFDNLYPNGKRYSRNWYNEEPQCFWDNANPTESQQRYNGKVCDEYPYASTIQGGPLNYQLNTVSLKLVDAFEQQVEWWGKENVYGQGWKLNQFYKLAPVKQWDPKFGWFIVGTRTQGESIWIDRNGNVNAF
jgi:hypothetical protein